MNIRFIKTSEKRRIIKKLNEQFGITKLPYLLIESGKEKLRAFSGHLSKEEISQLAQILNIEVIGLYLIKRENHSNFRLSLDATHLQKEQIKKNIISIDNNQLNEWLRGHDLHLSTDRGICIISHERDFLGCGKSNGSILINHIPKDRRIKK